MALGDVVISAEEFEACYLKHNQPGPPECTQPSPSPRSKSLQVVKANVRLKPKMSPRSKQPGDFDSSDLQNGWEAEREAMKEALDTAHARRAICEQRMIEDHRATVEQIKQEHQAALKQQDQKHQEALAQERSSAAEVAKEFLQAEFERQEEEHSAAITQLEQQHQAAIELLQQQHASKKKKKK